MDRLPGLVAELVQLKVDVLVRCRDLGHSRSQAGDQRRSHRHGDYSLIQSRLD